MFGDDPYQNYAKVKIVIIFSIHDIRIITVIEFVNLG